MERDPRSDSHHSISGRGKSDTPSSSVKYRREAAVHPSGITREGIGIESGEPSEVEWICMFLRSTKSKLARMIKQDQSSDPY